MYKRQGFLAESASDFMQSIVMIMALAVIVIAGTAAAGGLGAVVDNAKSIPGFFEFFGIATPLTVDGVQQSVNGQPLFGDAGTYGILSIVSLSLIHILNSPILHTTFILYNYNNFKIPLSLIHI